MSLHVAFDVSSLSRRDVTGVGVYARELCRALGQINGLQLEPFWPTRRFRHRKNFDLHVPGSGPWLFKRFKAFDVIHGPDFKVMRAGRAKRVVTIHDLAFFRDGMTSPEFAAKKKAEMDRLIRHFTPDGVLVVSEATKRDFVARYPEMTDKTSVTHLGGDHLYQAPPVSGATEVGDYFLFVGNLEARKNVLGLIKAFELYVRESSGATRLILVGKPGYQGAEILRAVEESPFRSRIEIKGYVGPDELSMLYRRAIAMVYPSWIEGFGIPVLEAMALGCPVITSAVTATAEVCGDTGRLVDPADTQGIAAAMAEAVQVVGVPERRRECGDRARARAREFTWRKCAERTFEVYLGLVRSAVHPGGAQP